MTDLGIGAGGIVGLAFETTAGTYTPPTKFFPVRSENLLRNQELTQRRVIRQSAEPIGVVPGNATVTGQIEMEILPDVLPYFLAASRGTVTKTGAAAPFTYEWVPGHSSHLNKTLSVTIVRNEQVFGYTGCIVGSSEYTTDSGIAIVRHNLIGMEEASQAMPTPVWPSQLPFGMGMYDIRVDGTTVCDVDNFTLTIDDGGVAEHRLCGTNGADIVRYGERSVTATMGRDFIDRTEYDEFKAVTAKALNIILERDADSRVAFNVPTAFMETYEIPMSGQGDLIRANVNYIGTYDPTLTAAAGIEVVTTEDATL